MSIHTISNSVPSLRSSDTRTPKLKNEKLLINILKVTAVAILALATPSIASSISPQCQNVKIPSSCKILSCEPYQSSDTNLAQLNFLHLKTVCEEKGETFLEERFTTEEFEENSNSLDKKLNRCESHLMASLVSWFFSSR